MTTKPVDLEALKLKKDVLVSSLFTLAKAAQESSNATIDFFNAVSGLDVDASSALASASQLSSLTAAIVSATDDGVKAVPATVPAAVEEAPAPEEKKKRKRAPADPNAPKKPSTAYLLFQAETRKQHKHSDTPMTNIDITQLWRNLTEDEKNVWKEKYLENLKDYKVVKQAYDEGKANGAVTVAVTAEEPVEVEETPASPEKHVVVAAPAEEPKTPKKKRKEEPEASTEKPEKKEKKDKRKEKKRRKSEAETN